MVILIGRRKESAVNVQKVLTAWGCIIKTRLGVHDGLLENCSNQGLLMLELVGDQSQKEELARKVSLIKGVHSQIIDLEVPEQENVRY